MIMARSRPVCIDNVAWKFSPRSAADCAETGDLKSKCVFLSEQQLKVLQNSRIESLSKVGALAAPCAATAGVHQCPCGNLVLSQRRKTGAIASPVPGYLINCPCEPVGCQILERLQETFGVPRRVQRFVVVFLVFCKLLTSSSLWFCRGMVVCAANGQSVSAVCLAMRLCVHPPVVSPLIHHIDSSLLVDEESDEAELDGDGLDGRLYPAKPEFASIPRPSPQSSAKTLSALSSAPVDIDDVLASRIGRVLHQKGSSPSPSSDRKKMCFSRPVL